ncbi:hypothetical protein GCM10025863_27690 [Microbacterium suwonense]|uniref:histidine kinase n=1 Tax=Microbacterium suwonense TaxID=683047 RepID=A0ABM8FWU1_9MICO|nr:hypothetical protein GCM10025863_27690 [Microbacterium suwonense]
MQEGVTNAIRHAPMASKIDVRIDNDATPIIIEIVNDGVTGPVSEGGFGLRGLAERAALLGGVVVSAPAGDGRWMLRAELPRQAGDSSGTSSPLISDAAPADSRGPAGAAATSRGGDAEAQSSTSPAPSIPTPAQEVDR